MSVCTDCPKGGYCPSRGGTSANMVWEPCPAGSFLPSTGAKAASDCHSCGAGKYNPIPGSTHSGVCKKCRRGTYAASKRKGECDLSRSEYRIQDIASCKTGARDCLTLESKQVLHAQGQR